WTPAPLEPLTAAEVPLSRLAATAIAEGARVLGTSPGSSVSTRRPSAPGCAERSPLFNLERKGWIHDVGLRKRRSARAARKGGLKWQASFSGAVAGTSGGRERTAGSTAR